MADDVEITEIVELQATKVSGVASPANGTPFLLLKSAASCATCDGKGTIMEGNRKCPDCDGATKSNSAEADEQQELMTGESAKSSSPEADAQQELMTGEAAKAKWDALDKALTAAERDKMPASSFAFIDKKGGKHLPIHDEGHTVAAKGRVGQQDFSEAKGDPGEAKKAAEAKIATAAKKFGIGAKKGAVQDGLNGTTTPQEAGHLNTGQSSLAGTVTTGKTPVPSTVPDGRHQSSTSGPTGQLEGGESAYSIPDEAKVIDNPVPLMKAVTSLVGAMDMLTEQRQAIKEGKYLQVTNPTGDAASAVSSMPWESYDSATLAQVAQCLAGCCAALDCIQERERIEALSGAGGDMEHVWDLGEAAEALDYAMGVAARLAFVEAAEGDTEVATKAGKVISGKNLEALQKAHDHLSAVIESAASSSKVDGDDDDEDENKASSAGESAEKEMIHMDITQSEFVASIREVMKAERETDEKAEKKARKRAEKEVKKNANNGGDITAQQEESGVNGENDADNVNSVPNGGDVKPEYVNKGDGEAEAELDPATKAVQEQLTEVAKELQTRLAAVEGTLSKIAKRPRSGGPSLDGQARGVPAEEGRHSDVAKASGDGEIEQLTKQLEETGDPLKKSELGLRLTRAQLVRAHEEGRL